MKMIRQLLIMVTWMAFLFSCKEKEKQPVVTTISPGKDSVQTTKDDIDANPYVVVDVSPMDMSYYPADYPKLKMARQTTQPPVARVIYSRPHLQGRELFHDVLKYGENWRLGANESTEIDFFRDVTILGKKIKGGRYILYSIPGPAIWTIVLNSNIDSWGLQQDSAKDIQRFEIPVTHGNPSLEYFTMVFAKTATGADLIMAWGDVLVKLPVTFNN
jgi:Protein of unknown function (DUF2911)